MLGGWFVVTVRRRGRETHEEVLGVDFRVLDFIVLRGDEDTFTEEVFVDLFAIGLGHQPGLL